MSPRRKALGQLGSGSERKRRTWSFERLEDRLCFSVAPLELPSNQLQTASYSSDTPEGAFLTNLREQQWAAMQSGDASSTAPTSLSTFALPNDPLFVNQWHLLNTGQEVGNPDFQHLFGVAGEDIHVVPVWNLGITGEGIVVAVIDTGVQINHPDLLGNISPTLRFNAITGTNNVTPDFIDPAGGHGTSVAGLIGATWNNLGAQVLDSNGDPVFDQDGNPVYTGGGTGVAPNVTLVPIKLIATGVTNQSIADAFQYALENGVDITNNSWGPGAVRRIVQLSPAEYDVLRDSVLFGRDGLGMINVFASGNSGGPSFGPGFQGFGNFDSAAYDPYVSSRYTIGVSGVDHDGLYVNADGTFTSYPEAGPGVLVAAPTGSNVAQNVADDSGQGSGLWTTDLIGDFGFNAAPLPSGQDLDRDLLGDPDYTSRFNGTSAATPLVTGVIALMLEANPNLTYRDVQEILLRSARQNAQFEIPSSGGGLQSLYSTWQTNQFGPFRDPDPWATDAPPDPFFALYDPLADPTLARGPSLFELNNLAFYDPAGGNDFGRILGHYEPQPGMFTNGAGYTVSQGYGVYGELIGYAHGVVDADLAVAMAKQWHTLGQNMDPFTEKTYTTFVLQGLGDLLPAERMPLNLGGLLVPGGIGSLAGVGYIAHWNEYLATPAPRPFDPTPPGPPGSWPQNTRGVSYIDFAVPPSEQINVEWVEVRVSISGDAPDLDYLKINLTSPDGTQSELNHYYADPNFTPFSVQDGFLSAPAGAINPGGDLNTGNSFVYTFSTNRNWGESTNGAVIIDPVTGEPVIGPADFNGIDKPIFRNWELHIENWSNTPYSLSGLEIVWHGKAVDGGALDTNWQADGWEIPAAQRIEGFVAVDTNGDNEFSGIDPIIGDVDNEWNNRYIQTVSDNDFDTTTIRSTDVVRRLLDDFNDNNGNGYFDAGDERLQEPFVANAIVAAYHFTVDPVSGLDIVDATPTAQFLTGADGNYYFDLVPGNYIIRVTDPLGRPKLDDVKTPAHAPVGSAYLPHYLSEWRITKDWFFAPDRDNQPSATIPNNPGEILFDPITKAPVPFKFDATEPAIPMAVQNINFFLKQEPVLQQFNVEGTVYADLNGNGIFDGDDALASNVFVYQDVNRNGAPDASEQRIQTDSLGHYVLTIPASQADTYAVGVIPPTSEWLPTDPGHDGVEDVFAGPGSPVQIVNFFLDPPADAFPNGGNGLGTIQGVVFNDLDADGNHDPGENGVPNFRVFIDANTNGVWDSATEASVLTGSNGSYFFSNVTPASVIRLDIVIPNEGTPAAAWSITKPILGYREVALGEGGSIVLQDFGLDNRADNDWGDLPDTYSTTAAANGPRHFVTPGFQLGASADGEVDGIPTTSATGEGLVGDNDDGVVVVSNSGILKQGVNTLRVTVAGVGGLLTGWMDFNADGHFDESERLTWTLAGNNLGGEADINQGTWDLQITIPAFTPDGPLAARFRWGEQGLSFTGPSAIGEVEDYFFGLNFLFGDYNHNGTVDNADYTVWRNTKGQAVTPFTGADGNGDGIVNQADYDVWRSHFGESVPAPGAGAGALVADGSDSSSSGSSGGLAAALTADSTSLAGGSGGANGQSYNALGMGGNVTTTPTQVGSVVETAPSSSAGVSLSSESFAFLATGGDETTAFQSDASLGQKTVAPAASSNSNLLLLDLAWAGVDDASYDVADDSLYDGSHHDDTHVSDLALAAVMTDESDWWDAI